MIYLDHNATTPLAPEALEADAAPKVVLESTHFATLDFVSLSDLQRHAQ